MTFPTTRGDARVHLAAGPGPAPFVLLMHGASGGVSSPVLLAVAAALAAAGYGAGLLEQPYAVAGRRAPDPARFLDAVCGEVVAALGVPGPLVLGGKSSGARVACRTAADLGAAAVVALGFPLRPPGRPGVSRADELALPRCPVLVVQGSRDPFGGPDDVAAAAPVIVHPLAAGDHSFVPRKADGRTLDECLAEAAGTVVGFLRQAVAT